LRRTIIPWGKVSRLSRGPEDAGANKPSLLAFLPQTAGRSRRATPTDAHTALGLVWGAAQKIQMRGEQNP
jgi:hypothetical protein